MALATASFPCNDLSLAGARAGLKGKQSSAYWGFVRIMREMEDRRPAVILLENVTGLLTSHRGEDFKEALLALNGLGYTVDAFILDAICFVPQSRQRLFVVAVMQESNNKISTREAPYFFESEVRPKALAKFIFHNSEVNWRIRSLPPLPRPNTKLDSILESLSHDSAEWWGHDRAVYLLNQMSPRHKSVAQKMIDGRRWSFGTVFRRVRNGRSMAELRTDGVAGCLRTPRGGSGRQILFKAGYGSYFVRLLTPRECASLMGASHFKINASLNQALFGFGDAVCVPVIEWIAENYLDPLVEESSVAHSVRSHEEKQYAKAV